MMSLRYEKKFSALDHAARSYIVWPSASGVHDLSRSIREIADLEFDEGLSNRFPRKNLFIKVFETKISPDWKNLNAIVLHSRQMP